MSHPRWTRRLIGLVLPCCLAGCSATAGVGAPEGATGPGGEGGGTPGSLGTSALPEVRGGTPSAPATATVLPTEAELHVARSDVAKLDLPRLAAQLVVPRHPGTGEAAAQAVRRDHVGGLVAFGDAIPRDPDRVRPEVGRANRVVQEAMRTDGRGWPAFLAIDQEGGSVNRIGHPLTRFPAPMALGAARNPELTARVGLISGSELRELGFTVVLAPSADVTAGAADPTIGTRSPGSDPAGVIAVARALLVGYRQAGVLPTLKHFPGHGGVRADSHLGVARQPASLAELRRRDLRPFAELAAATPAVMVGHVELTAVDSTGPATVSKAVVSGLLRTGQRFGGLVVSDALEMGAITDRYGAGEAAVRAIEAGGDVLLIPADTRAAIDALTAAVRSGRLSRARLEESAARMIAALRHAQASAPRVSSPGTGRETARALAAASITQLDGGCGRRMVARGIAIVGGDAGDRAGLAAAARSAGLSVGSGTVVRLIAGGGYRAADARGAGESARGPRVRTGEVTVALDRPYGLAAGSPGAVLIATYGETPATFTALVDVLLGKHKAGGRLPVRVGRYPIGSGCR